MATIPSWPELAQGNTGNNVCALQCLLNYRNNNTALTVDGSFGPAVYNAVVAYQSNNGLTANGVAGANTLSSLIATVQYGAVNNAVRAAQHLLSKFETLTIDGSFGPGMLTVTESFQESMEIDVDGSIGPTTWRYLFGYDSYPNSNSDYGDYITAGVGGWLKLYKQPTSSKTGRTVTIPTVASFTGSDGYSYSFTDKNYWYAYENPYGTNRINPYAITQIEAATGSEPVVNVGSNGEYTDENGNYWMAVGPKVPYPNQSSSSNITPANMYGLGKLDVVVKDSSGTLYYIPGIIGDIKAHTWSNGIIQTFKAYPSGTFTSAGGNFNGTVCAEFIGNLGNKLTGLYNYSVVKIIFYEN